MNPLLKKYDQYLTRQDVPSVHELFEEIVNFDFKNHDEIMRECFAIRSNVTCTDFVKLKTNKNHEYRFGPHFLLWRQLLEGFLRAGDWSKEIIFVNWKIHLKDYINDTFTNFNLLKSTNSLKEYVKRRSSNNQIGLFTHNQVILFLSKSDEFLKDIDNLGISHFSTLESPFFDAANFKDKIKINDQMMSWRSGLNFFTCSKGSRHFLPLFFQQGPYAYNLLNLTERYGCDSDYIELHERRICECGRACIDFTFIPHINELPIINDKITFDLSIASNLQEQYFSFQLAQSNKQNYLYFISREDKGRDNEYRSQLSQTYHAKIIENKAIIVGGQKFPPFIKQETMRVFNLKPRAIMLI